MSPGVERDAASLALRNLLFTLAIPGAGAVLIPWWILTSRNAVPEPVGWPGLVIIVGGAGLYASCLWFFGAVGQGTPGPWDAPRHLVAIGPYRWVRNPIYLSALLVMAGEAWLFLSPAFIAYAALAALVLHLFAVAYEEPTLRHRFGRSYDAYVRAVPRWIPRRPRIDGGARRP